MPSFFPGFIVFIFGVTVGSFLNVCIYRIPVGLSVVSPRSICPKCNTPIPFYDNIPILSYVLLKGRCRHCGDHISFRYPVIELVSGLFALAILFQYGLSIRGLILYIFIASLLVITFIDIDYTIIPDAITVPGIFAGFLTSFISSQVTYKESLLGVLLGGGSLYIVAWTYHLLTGKEGMGGGDIKLLAMIGAFLGWHAVLFTIFVASVLGTLSGLTIMLFSGGDLRLAIPFGPFLALGAMAYLFIGPVIIFWCFNLTG
nr:prepilin peptidase [Desulfobacterales bacterium]